MPYKIEQQGEKFKVINSDTGKIHGEHASRAKAEAQLRALYANEPEANKSGRRNSGADVDRLRKIQALIDELLSSEGVENEDIQPVKALDLSYIKSIGSIVTPEQIAVKSIGRDEIQGYVTLWGNERLTDVEAEYFTRETDFWDGILGKSPRPLTWDHAQDKSLKASPVIGQMIDFGDDNLGRWYVAKMEQSHQYRKAIDALLEAGLLGTSSDSAPQYVERVTRGKSTWLKTWPLFAAALTHTPAEPRMVGSLEFLKSIGVTFPENSQQRGWEWLSARMKRYRMNTGE